MLYDRWSRIARAHSDRSALFDIPGSRLWTFSQLFRAVEAAPELAEPIVYPQGITADFVLSVLRAWRCGKVVCPLESSLPRPEISQALPASIVHLKMTSATTGNARLIAFTAEQLIADVDNIVESMGLRPEWPNLAVISLAHSYGFSNLVLPLLLHGIPMVVAGSVLPEALRAAAESQTAVTLAAVPALWQTWNAAEAIPANVRLAISAGAPLPLPLEQTVFARHGLKIHNFYGSSECGGIAYDTSNAPRTEAAYVGNRLRHVDVQVSKDGCFQVRSGAVAQSYWPTPEPQLSRGVFITSDVGLVSGERVFLHGRAGDQINVAGRKVLPETIEAVLSGHPHVRACLAFGVPSLDAQRGETIVACVAGKAPALGDSLKQFALAKLPAWQVPRDWWFVDSLEAGPRGKLSRAEWRKRYLEMARSGVPLKVNSPRSTT